MRATVHWKRDAPPGVLMLQPDDENEREFLAWFYHTGAQQRVGFAGATFSDHGCSNLTLRLWPTDPKETK